MTTEALDPSVLQESLETATTAIVEFDRIAAGIAAIEAEHPKDIACDVRTGAGMKQAIAGRAAWRGPRVAVEHARKAAKAPVLQLGREIDAFAKGLEARLLEGESHYDRQIKAEEQRREAEREAKLEAERRRVVAIRERIDWIRSAPVRASGKPLAVVRALGHEVFALAIDESFEEFDDEAQQVKAETLDAMRSMIEAAEEAAEAAARAAAEAKRLQEEREALERERTEQARVLAEQEEAARLEREAADRVAAAERAEREEAARREREEADRVAREARDAEAARLAELRTQQEEEMREQRAELERQQAELEAKRREEEERVAAEQAEAARLAGERLLAEELRLNRLYEAAPKLLVAAKAAIYALGRPDDVGAREATLDALRRAVAAAEPNTAEEAT